MKVFIKNKFISFGGGSTVKDENGNDVYYVKGRVFSPTRVKFVCDMDGNKLYKVRNKWFNYFTYRAYVYDQENNKIACVKHPPFSGKKYIIQGYQDEINIDGAFFSATSTITRNGEEVGKIIRTSAIINDAFCLEADEKDMPFMIALVIAIDNIVDKITRSK